MTETSRKIRLIAVGALMAVIGGAITKQARRNSSDSPSRANEHLRHNESKRPLMVSRELPETSDSSSPPLAEGRILSRLNAASTLVMSAAIVATLIVSYLTLRSQLQQHNAAVRASAQTAKVAFASKVAFWWSPAAHRRIEILHVQNGNPLPVDAWTVYLADDKHPAPGSGIPLAKVRLLGAFAPPPFEFVGQVPPCSVVEVRAPFKSWYKPHAFNTLPTIAEGDLVFTDPSGVIWRRGLSGLLHTVPFSIKGPGAAIFEIVSSYSIGIEGSTWFNRSASPVCG